MTSHTSRSLHALDVEIGALKQYQTDASRAIAELRAENERLTKCLKTANEQAEKFEREWYLRGDENERLRKALELIAGCQSRVPGDVQRFVDSLPPSAEIDRRYDASAPPDAAQSGAGGGV